MKKFVIFCIIFKVILTLICVATFPMLSNATDEAAKDLPQDTVLVTQKHKGEYIQKVNENDLKISNDFELKWDDDAQGFIIVEIRSNSPQITIPTSFSGKPIVAINKGVLNATSVDEVIIPENLKIDEKINLDTPTRDGFTFIGWTVEIRDGQKIYIANWKQTNITYDKNKTAIKVDDTVSAEFFGAACYDNVSKKNLDVAIEAETIGELEAGKVISVKLSAKDCETITVENIKVYGAPTVVMAEFITVSTDINNVANVTDSFGEKLNASVTCDGEMVGGSKINVTVKATDAAGNNVENTLNYDVHEDGNKDHKCDFCEKALSVCTDEDKNHVCEFCENKLSDCIDNDKNHICEYCNLKATQCADEDKNHSCDVCGISMGEHKDVDSDGDHICNYCGQVLSECEDVDKNHYCDECNKDMGKHLDSLGDGDHVCDYCRKAMNDCQDENKDHKCDECDNTLGKHADDENDGDHLCEYCVKVSSECLDKDKDHKCDECNANVAEHADSNGDRDHLCDHCDAQMNVCEDKDKNHYCDECSADIGIHQDDADDGDHFCEYCGKSVNSCVDSDKNHICDECGNSVGLHSDKLSDGDHLCDYCNKTASSCADYDKNHACDECSTYMGTHSDKMGDGNHLCEYCNKSASDCVDSDKNHACDECGDNVGAHFDSEKDGDHICDYCKNTITMCSDMDSNGYCDECGNGISYTVHYNSNGGIGTVDFSTHIYDIEKNLNANNFIRNGYIFEGWNTKSNGTGIDYADGARVKNLVTTGTSITLYAMWKVDPCTISKYVATGTVVSDTKGTKQYVVYTTIDSTPFSLKQNSIIDWSSEKDTNLLQHPNRAVNDGRFNNIDISNTTADVTFIGATSQEFTNLKMYICHFAEGQKLTLRFVNFNFVTNESCAISLFEDKGLDLTIDIVGNCSIKTVVNSGSIIGQANYPIKNLTFVGDGAMNIAAGHGANATTDGADGADGGTAIYAVSLTVNIENALVITGGNGGNGFAGKKGENGVTIYDYTFVRNVIGVEGVHIKTVNCYNKATNGAVGQNGGAGGNAGKPVDCVTFTTDGEGLISLVFGNGGNGAKGGEGGNGGKGANLHGVVTEIKFVTAYNPGEGGNAGNGGKGGNAGHSVNIEYDFDYENIQIVRGLDGTPGEGGSPGKVGEGGDGGTIKAIANNHSAEKANSGLPGTKGSSGNP